MKHLPYGGSACVIAADISTAATGTVFASGPNVNPNASSDPGSKEFYTTRITDILQNNCVDCHDKTAKGGLRLDFYTAMMKGGPVIIPGDPDKSLLIQAIRRAGDLKMLLRRPLDPAAVEDLAAWVKAGAVEADPVPSVTQSASLTVAPSSGSSARFFSLPSTAGAPTNRLKRTRKILATASTRTSAACGLTPKRCATASSSSPEISI